MTPSTNDTAFVCVPGGYCPGSYFERVTSRLHSLGYSAVAVDLPTIGNPDKPPAGMEDDVAHVQSTITNLLDQGKDVILIGNSYGTFVMTEAARGLDKVSRQAMGRQHALTHMVYIATLFPPIGISVHELIAEQVDVQTIADNEFINPPPPDVVARMLLNDLPEEDQKQYSTLKCISSKCFHSKCTYEGYLHVPTTQVICEHDQAVPPKAQHESGDGVIARGGNNVRKTSLQADHCAMISHPDEIVVLLLEAAGIGR